MGRILYIKLINPNIITKDFDVYKYEDDDTNKMGYSNDSTCCTIYNRDYFLNMDGKTAKDVEHTISKSIDDIMVTNSLDDAESDTTIRLLVYFLWACKRYPTYTWYIYEY